MIPTAEDLVAFISSSLAISNMVTTFSVAAIVPPEHILETLDLPEPPIAIEIIGERDGLKSAALILIHPSQQLTDDDKLTLKFETLNAAQHIVRAIMAQHFDAKNRAAKNN